MSSPMLLALLWCVVANVTAMFPSKHKHWPAAYVLITFGLPILAWVYWESGFIIGLLFTIAGASVLRWPVRYLLRWCRTVVMDRANG